MFLAGLQGRLRCYHICRCGSLSLASPPSPIKCTCLSTTPILPSSYRDSSCPQHLKMRRQRNYPQYETALLRPTWKRASSIVREIPDTSDPDTRFLLGAVLFVVLVCGLFLIGFRRRKSRSLPDVPWVGRDKIQWFSKLRARTWTTVNYETALREAYDKVKLLKRNAHTTDTDRKSVSQKRPIMYTLRPRWRHSRPSTFFNTLVGQLT